MHGIWIITVKKLLHEWFYRRESNYQKGSIYNEKIMQWHYKKKVKCHYQIRKVIKINDSLNIILL